MIGTVSGKPVGVIQRLMQELTRLPGIGPKSAERLTHFLLSGDRSTARDLAQTLRDVVEQVKPCRVCFNLTDGDLCEVCRDPHRDPTLLCVVEFPRDLAIFERLGTYRGLYHVLGGRLNPIENVGPDSLTFDALLRRVINGNIREVILATSPTTEGDGTALYASQILANTGVKISRLARGLPSGASLELANTQMLRDALEGRRTFS